MGNGKANLTSKSKDDLLDSIFFALSDRNRRKILKMLSEKDLSVSEIAEILAISLPGTLKHLGILGEADLVLQEKNGRVRSCSFRPKGFAGALSYIEEYKEFWEAGFDRIEALLLKKDRDRDG